MHILTTAARRVTELLENRWGNHAISSVNYMSIIERYEVGALYLGTNGCRVKLTTHPYVLCIQGKLVTQSIFFSFD